MKKYLDIFRVFFYIIFLLVFALTPLYFFKANAFCVYRELFGMLCAGCGVTRGFCAFMHLDFFMASQYNPVFAYAVFPISIFLMLEDSVVVVLRRLKKIKRKSLLELGFSAVGTVFIKK